jgi:hypothetical protein
MGFLAPLMLLGTAAAAIPIALHFFFRSRYRVVPWAAMKFLLTSIEQTSRRLKFQELLLLILRCALMLALAVALARFTGCGRGGEVTAAFVIDNSYSMGAREGNTTRFEQARAAALKALDELPAHSTVQIFTCGSTVSEPLLHETGRPDQARKVIESLELAGESTDFAPGLGAALAYLKATPSATRELYLFSDMQRSGWEQHAGEITNLLTEARALGTVFLVRCGTRKLTNATVVGLVPQKGVPHARELLGFSVLVRNTGAETLRQVQVTLAVDGKFEGAETRTLSELPAGHTRTVALNARFDSPGLHTLTALLSNDDLPGDNWFDQVIEVPDKVNLLVLDGSYYVRDPVRWASFHLANALVPVKEAEKASYHIQILQIPAELASAALLSDKALCVFANVPLSGEFLPNARAPRPEFLDELAQFVKDGKALLVFGGDKVEPAAYNYQLGKRGLLPVPMTAVEAYPAAEPINLDRATATSVPAFRRFAEEEYYKEMNVIPVWQTIGLEDPLRLGKTPGAATTVLRYSNGKPAVVTGKVGRGEVMVYGTSADPVFKPGTRIPTWNLLYHWPAGYVPLMEVSVNHLLHGQAQDHNGRVGEPLRYEPHGAKAERSFLLIEPADRDPLKPGWKEGRQLPLGPAKQDQGRAVVTAPGPAKAGVYYLTTRENEAGDRMPYAVVPDLQESANLEALSEADINKQLGFAPVHLTVKEGQELDFAAERTNREWTLWLLVVVLLLALAEVGLAWMCGRAW